MISDNFQIGPDGAFERLEIDKEQLYKLYMEWVDSCSLSISRRSKAPSGPI